VAESYVHLFGMYVMHVLFHTTIVKKRFVYGKQLKLRSRAPLIAVLFCDNQKLPIWETLKVSQAGRILNARSSG